MITFRSAHPYVLDDLHTLNPCPQAQRRKGRHIQPEYDPGIAKLAGRDLVIAEPDACDISLQLSALEMDRVADDNGTVGRDFAGRWFLRENLLNHRLPERAHVKVTAAYRESRLRYLITPDHNDRCLIDHGEDVGSLEKK